MQGLEISKEEGLRYAEGGAIKSIGDVFFELGDYKTARHYIESGIMEETGNRLDEAGRINLANTLISLRKLSESERGAGSLGENLQGVEIYRRH